MIMKKYSVSVIILVIVGFLLSWGGGTIAQQPQQQKETMPKLLTPCDPSRRDLVEYLWYGSGNRFE